jgi:hypothetical protein
LAIRRAARSSEVEIDRLADVEKCRSTVSSGARSSEVEVEVFADIEKYCSIV